MNFEYKVTVWPPPRTKKEQTLAREILVEEKKKMTQKVKKFQELKKFDRWVATMDAEYEREKQRRIANRTVPEICDYIPYYDPPICECWFTDKHPGGWYGEDGWDEGFTKRLGPNLRQGFAMKKCETIPYLFHVSFFNGKHRLDCCTYSDGTESGSIPLPPAHVVVEYCLTCKQIVKRTFDTAFKFKPFVEWTICDSCRK